LVYALDQLRGRGKLADCDQINSAVLCWQFSAPTWRFKFLWTRGFNTVLHPSILAK
jgi:hypothetical protein